MDQDEKNRFVPNPPEADDRDSNFRDDVDDADSSDSTVDESDGDLDLYNFDPKQKPD